MRTRACFAVSAPAKINLLLRVGPQGADGYHEIFSIVQQVSLCDRIRVTGRRRGLVLSCHGLAVPPGRDNLVVRAAERLQRMAKRSEGAAIRLDKRIPIGAGLGGGSSDAAAVVLALNRLWRLGWSKRQLSEAVAPLGSDIALFFASPLAVVEGTGGAVRSLPHPFNRPFNRPVNRPAGRRTPRLPSWLVLVYPGVVSPTAEAYRALDRRRRSHRAPSRPGFPQRFPQRFPLTHREREIIISRFLLRGRTPVHALLDNDFGPVIFDAFPPVRRAAEGLARTGAEGVLLSGSGSAVFGLFSTARSARSAAAAIRDGHPEWDVWVVRPLRRAVSVRGVRSARTFL
jgi:4-diphosphocytidyl-2-C-methyl-D-erythritol kinase